MKRIALALVLLASCTWNRAAPPSSATGWHRCPGKATGCVDGEVCSPHGCRWWGSVDGPGAADADHDGSDPSQVPER